MKRIALAALLATGCGDESKIPVADLQDPTTCLECHPKHYQQWSGSMHAYASDDPVFVAMNNRGQREAQLGTFCVQCHAPMAVALGMTDGTNFDPTTLPPRARGVTCYFCHDVAKVAGDHNNGLQLAMDDRMSGGVVNPIDSPAHRSAFDPQLASATNNSQMCGSCHDVVTPRGVALERTYQEWQATIFAANDPARELPLTCSGCHMASSDGLIAQAPGLGTHVRPSGFHEHMWPGIDVAVTSFPETTAQSAAIARDLGPALTIVGPAPSTSTIGAGGICVTPLGGGTLTVRMDTRGTGHMWPSGAAQDRRAWLEVLAYDTNNNVVFSSGAVPEGRDPEDLQDPALFGLWDRTFKDDGMPAHFFWEVATVDSQLLRAPTTLVKTDPAFDHSSTATFAVGALHQQFDHITARVRIRPLSYAIVDDLVASGDLDPGVAHTIETLDVAGATRHWTRADANAVVPFSGCVASPYQ